MGGANIKSISWACFSLTQSRRRFFYFIASLRTFLVSLNYRHRASNDICPLHHKRKTVFARFQQEGHDIFSLLGPDEFRTVLKVIEKAIMATDLTNYLSNRDELATHLENGTLNFYQDESHRYCPPAQCAYSTGRVPLSAFNVYGVDCRVCVGTWSLPSSCRALSWLAAVSRGILTSGVDCRVCRDLIIALIMSGVDLADCCKPWDINVYGVDCRVCRDLIIALIMSGVDLADCCKLWDINVYGVDCRVYVGTWSLPSSCRVLTWLTAVNCGILTSMVLTVGWV